MLSVPKNSQHSPDSFFLLNARILAHYTGLLDLSMGLVLPEGSFLVYIFIIIWSYSVEEERREKIKEKIV